MVDVLVEHRRQVLHSDYRDSPSLYIYSSGRYYAKGSGPRRLSLSRRRQDNWEISPWQIAPRSSTTSANLNKVHPTIRSGDFEEARKTRKIARGVDVIAPSADSSLRESCRASYRNHILKCDHPVAIANGARPTKGLSGAKRKIKARQRINMKVDRELDLVYCILRILRLCTSVYQTYLRQPEPIVSEHSFTRKK